MCNMCILEYASGNFTEEVAPPATGAPPGGVSSLPNIVEIDVIPGTKTKNGSRSRTGGGRDKPKQGNTMYSTLVYLYTCIPV